MSELVVAVEWTMDDAVALVRQIQPVLHERKWHMALGGSVLNTGASGKDADVYVLPFSDTPDVTDILPTLVQAWGAWEPIGIGYDKQGIFAAKVKFQVDGKRVDAFIGRCDLPAQREG